MAASESEKNPHIPIHTQRSPSVDRQKQTEKLARQVKELRMAFAITFSTPEGHRVLRWIIEQAGYQRSNIGGNPGLGMNVLQGTLYNSARQSVYLEMRQLIPATTLKLVEYEQVKEIFE